MFDELSPIQELNPMKIVASQLTYHIKNLAKMENVTRSDILDNPFGGLPKDVVDNSDWMAIVPEILADSYQSMRFTTIAFSMRYRFADDQTLKLLNRKPLISQLFHSSDWDDLTQSQKNAQVILRKYGFFHFFNDLEFKARALKKGAYGLGVLKKRGCSSVSSFEFVKQWAESNGYVVEYISTYLPFLDLNFVIIATINNELILLGKKSLTPVFTIEIIDTETENECEHPCQSSILYDDGTIGSGNRLFLSDVEHVLSKQYKEQMDFDVDKVSAYIKSVDPRLEVMQK